MKKIGKILKRVVFSFGIIYGIDVMLNKMGVFIPLNIFTITITTILGTPGLLSLFAIFYLIK